MTREELNAFIDSVVALRGNVTDKEASSAVAIYPALHADGRLIRGGTRINWNGQLKRAAADLNDTELNNPDNAPVLWEDVMYKEGIRIIPKVITAGLKFSENERGWWKDAVYISLIDNNTWTPEDSPALWKKE